MKLTLTLQISTWFALITIKRRYSYWVTFGFVHTFVSCRLNITDTTIRKWPIIIFLVQMCHLVACHETIMHMYKRACVCFFFDVERTNCGWFWRAHAFNSSISLWYSSTLYDFFSKCMMIWRQLSNYKSNKRRNSLMWNHFEIILNFTKE